MRQPTLAPLDGSSNEGRKVGLPFRRARRHRQVRALRIAVATIPAAAAAGSGTSGHSTDGTLRRGVWRSSRVIRDCLARCFHLKAVRTIGHDAYAIAAWVRHTDVANRPPRFRAPPAFPPDPPPAETTGCIL